MVRDAADVPAGPRSVDSVGVEFDEERLISDAGLLTCARARSATCASSTVSSMWRSRGMWEAGTGPGELPLVVDRDSFVGEVHAYEKRGAGYGYTRTFEYHPIVATHADTGSLMNCLPVCTAPAVTVRSCRRADSGVAPD